MGEAERLLAFNFRNWVERYQHLLQSSAAEPRVWSDAQLRVTVVRGPSQRTDFHDAPVDRFFHQVCGDMLLKVVDDGTHYDAPIRIDENFLLPCHVRCSPQWPQPDSIGLVVEPLRPDGAVDAFEWYCFECDRLVHRVEIDLERPAHQMPSLHQAFHRSRIARTCRHCGALHPGKDPPCGWVRL